MANRLKTLLYKNLAVLIKRYLQRLRLLFSHANQLTR